MTDTVNVPREPTDAEVDAVIEAMQKPAPPIGAEPTNTLDRMRYLARVIASSVIAAAPKAEPAQPEAQKGETVDEEIGEEYDIAAHCVTLAECPAGLFFWNGSLGFKSEYGAMEPDETSNGKLWRVSNRPDAYCADSGEYFWGGSKTHDERANVLVYPVSSEAVAMVASHGHAALYTHPAPASDELLEASVSLQAARDAHSENPTRANAMAVCEASKNLDRAIAKHKGPQS